MSRALREFLVQELQNLKAAGLYQEGMPLASPPGGKVKIGSREVVNFASDDYLGWAHDSRLSEAAIDAVKEWGTGWASSRVISGSNLLHKKLEEALSRFLKTEETLLYSSGYQARMGLFESVFGEQDYLFCDFSLQPATVDGIRLCSGRHLIFKTHDLRDLEDNLKRSPDARFRAIIIESVAAQDGTLAPIREILALARAYDSALIVDDSHALGVTGKTGKGSNDAPDLAGQLDITVGSFGKALGGIPLGFASGRKEMVAWLRQKSRPYLFSTAPSAAALAVALRAIELLSKAPPEITRLAANTSRFRAGLSKAGFELVSSEHPIVSIVVKDAVIAQKFANRLLQKGFYALGFCYPVVPRGSARIRAQISAAHTQKDLDEALQVFEEAGKNLKII